jgi:porphobilinogen synthase
LRDLASETSLEIGQLVQPLFVVEDESEAGPLDGLPGILRVGVDGLAGEAEQLHDARVGGILLFGTPIARDEAASGAYHEGGVVQRGIRAVKDAVPDLVLITDVCLCAYTSHGHCGLVRDGEILNDLSLELIARTALSHAEAGADIVAPSDMLDGRVAALRALLDAEGLEQTGILSYGAKYASALYGPFRDAVDSAPSFGDRRTHQLDVRNRREAMRELELDVGEGADAVMVKPALSCLDVIAEARTRVDVPLGAYNTSGEYAMIRAAADRGWLDERATAIETTLAIRRAGADLIVSYWSRELARWL